MYIVFINLAKVILKPILITHPLNIDRKIINIPPFIVYDYIIGLTITWRFYKWGLLALNRVKKTQGAFWSDSTNQNKEYTTSRATKIAHANWIKWWIDAFYLMPSSLQLYKYLSHHYRLTPVISPMFGVCFVHIMGIVYVPLLVYFFKLEMKLYVILWQLPNFEAEIAKDSWSKICEKNDDK